MPLGIRSYLPTSASRGRRTSLLRGNTTYGLRATYLSASSLVSLVIRHSGGGKGRVGSSKGGGVCRCSGGGQMKGSEVPLVKKRRQRRAQAMVHVGESYGKRCILRACGSLDAAKHVNIEHGLAGGPQCVKERDVSPVNMKRLCQRRGKKAFYMMIRTITITLRAKRYYVGMQYASSTRC